MNKKESPRIMTANKYLPVVAALAAALLTVQISGLQAGETDPDSSLHVQYPDSLKLFTPSHNFRILASVPSSALPLIVLDGKVRPCEDTNRIDPLTIKNITVLTGKMATDLYGEKAKDGVMMITTKDSVKSVRPQQPAKTETIPDYRTRQGAVYVPDGNDHTTAPVSDDPGVNVRRINPVIHGWKDFGENKPLYIVDGKKTRNVGKISPENIQSITIVKDQTAISLYGHH